MALHVDFRFVLENATGVQLDSGIVTLAVTPQQGDGSGGVTSETEQEASNTQITAGSEETLITITGSNDVTLTGGVFVDMSNNGATPSGDVNLWVEERHAAADRWSRDPIPTYTQNFTSLSDDTENIRR